MKTKTAILIASAWASIAQAHVKVPNLWNDYNRQLKWEEVSVQAEGVKGQLRAYLSEDKSVQLDEASGNFVSAANLTSSSWGMLRRKSAFIEDCHLIVGAIDRIRTKRFPFTLTMSVIPMSAQANLLVTRKSGSQEQLPGPVNEIGLTGIFDVELKPGPDALVSKTGLDIEIFQNELLSQLGKQKASLMATGQVVFDLTTFDDVACDLLNNKASLVVAVNTKFVRPKLVRTPLFETSEIERLIGGLVKRNAELADGADPKVMNPAYLSLELVNIRRGIDELDAWEFARLHGLLFDPVTGQMRSLPNQKMSEVASSMDRLATQNGGGKMSYTLKLTGD